ncbi:Na+/H+ antiporter subunit E [Acinetobacter sp. ANC 3791]|uniref:Na+/H+ antiporter subunit E n=1 Tax=Acinetobacter sp. ANC 3791 TaxID=2529836 RepID=UPI00103C8507|nr:Na+/H+ antiporter subunit E [Acinetobacter sp. ANC 3791]TCB84882.1 Na+/H+ antiporter subunit E [Acinetobacter sp. ANC 3791]
MAKFLWIDRCLPHPFVSVMVGLSWLMLSHSLDASDLLMAVLLAVLIPKLLQHFITRTPHIDSKQAIRLFFVVLYDVIVANFVVAKLVLGSTEKLQPKWFRVPLDSQHEQVNSLLAMIITTTPGTVSAGIDQERGDILVHALSCSDPQAEIDQIKQRYEAPLLKIFHAKQGETP